MSKAMDNVEKVKEAARHNFYNGLNCCESVYEALLATGTVSEADAPYFTCAMCAGFGGGGGLSGYTCGALSGAILGVGARHGRKAPKTEKPDGLYDVEYRRYNNLVSDFKDRLGSVLCREITVDHQDDWGGQGRKDHCAKAVDAASELACKYLDLETKDVNQMTWKENMAGKK